jgi:LacI family transcriptional regulator
MSLAKIAANLGISITTVSRALGGYADVASATRQRVQDEAQRLRYRPNENARRLRRGRADAIGIIVPAAPGDFGDPFFLRMLAAIGPALAQANLDMLVTTARPGAEELRAYRQMVETRKVDGLLLARTRRRDERISYLLDHGMPFVAHGRAAETRPFAWLDIDGEAACKAATERLVGLGHRRIGLINAPAIYSFAHHREAGWHAALWAAQLPPGPIAHVEPSEEAGFVAARSMLRDAAPPSAILCATDRLAVGCLHALADAGLRAGRDVSVIGYDNLPVATYTDPPLTTIAQPIERAAARMVEMLLALIGGAAPDGMQELWQAELIQRASDGPARPAAASPPQGGNDNHATPDNLRP